MTAPPDKKLSMEDRILWGRVARSATPLPGKVIDEAAPPAEDFASLLDAPRETGSTRPEAQAPEPNRPASHARQHRLDAPVREKLAKGRLPIEGKVDLHGLTQSQAHTLLLSFLHRAYADGRRHVLVVTGKGSSIGSDGVLRRAVPAWFATPPFRALVSAHEDAARRHGGSGALYVRLRRSGGGV
jgi:DNA-nicking Smr family endonuclease